jgi:hypothetical protein
MDLAVVCVVVRSLDTQPTVNNSMTPSDAAIIFDIRIPPPGKSFFLILTM